ncbi:MAG TPA: hypothetical protein VF245_02430 [Solirubrobacterales bacterium]
MRTSLNVGPLNVVGQGQGQLQRVEHPLVIEVQGGDPAFDAIPTAPDAGLLLSEQVLADLVGVVGFKELALLLGQACSLSFGLGDLCVCGLS